MSNSAEQLERPDFNTGILHIHLSNTQQKAFLNSITNPSQIERDKRGYTVRKGRSKGSFKMNQGQANTS